MAGAHTAAHTRHANAAFIQGPSAIVSIDYLGGTYRGTGLSVCSGAKKVAFWPIWRRPVLRAGGCFRGEVFADVLLFSSGFGSYRCHDLFSTNFDHVNTVLLMTKYDPDSLSPFFLSLFLLLLHDTGFPTVY